MSGTRFVFSFEMPPLLPGGSGNKNSMEKDLFRQSDRAVAG